MLHSTYSEFSDNFPQKRDEFINSNFSLISFLLSDDISHLFSVLLSLKYSPINAFSSSKGIQHKHKSNNCRFSSSHQIIIFFLLSSSLFHVESRLLISSKNFDINFFFL
ncbi:hypothetical protein CSA08_03120 [Candidatus Gracilibacteria bacterium]|nr:MAG: hypothetical protein CSA08_03120 [Candidatus Gracilibacteria bacterium]